MKLGQNTWPAYSIVNWRGVIFGRTARGNLIFSSAISDKNAIILEANVRAEIGALFYLIG